MLLGIPFEPVILEWNALIEGLADGSVHFTGELTPTAERREIYLMTDPIAERSLKYFRTAGAEPLADIAKTRKLRYAFLTGATSLTYVRTSTEYPFDAFLLSE